jgi:hypothetical protein
MSFPSRRNRGRQRRVRLSIEGLETRNLLTLSPVLLAVSPIFHQALPAQTDGLTPREMVRERFTATFSGQFTQGPGRFTSQASQIFVSGGGLSSAFRHGDLQLALFIPKDPSAAVTGEAFLIVKNVSNSGNLLDLDLQTTPQQLDPNGRPTLLTWTVGGSSGGTFNGATGSGTLEIRYRPFGRANRRGVSAGGANVLFHGQINTIGVGNVLLPVASVVR